VPLSAYYFADILYEAGLPPEMLQVLHWGPARDRRTRCWSTRCGPHHLHGRVPIGKYIAHKAGYRRIVLELGGNDP
jgi:acyl-CoA reductase-like NAD-dependent aldehyde dehydrogenase